MADLLASPTFEILPIAGAAGLMPLLPPGAQVAVTASPSRGLEATLAFSEQLAAAGFGAVPHLAAHQVRDAAHLRSILDRLRAAGIGRCFVVGGDATQAGAYLDAVALLREMADIAARPGDIGIAAYPQGHPSIAAAALQAALAAKAPYATFMTTQLCFDAAALGSWLTARRAEGLALPVLIGIPGAAEVRRLLRISARVGVTDASRFVRKNLGLVRRLLSPGGYRPDSLLHGLAPLIADQTANVVGLHLYTFNEVASTEAWRREYLAALRTP